MTSESLALLKTLIAEPSITPNDANCQPILIERLKKIGFQIENLPFGEVKNFYARRGNTEPVFLFAGHTDVVPPGPEDKWRFPPFEPTIENGVLYGRGAADMKSGIAAMICACENFIKQYPDHQGSIAFLITSDEEGKAIHGTREVVKTLLARKEKIAWCIVGEASSEKLFGDTIKVGRRGSLSGKLIITGKQGHIAYPAKADNPIHKSLLALTELTHQAWDRENDFFPATQFQISNIHAGTGANNVIPGHLEIDFNFRYNTESNAQSLKQQVHAILDANNLNYQIDWHESGEPFRSELGTLYQATTETIEEITGITTQKSTSGGTSDGRFIIQLGCEILELGPVNQSIHQIDENISLEDLELLTKVYQGILTRLLTTNSRT